MSNYKKIIDSHPHQRLLNKHDNLKHNFKIAMDTLHYICTADNEVERIMAAEQAIQLITMQQKLENK